MTRRQRKLAGDVRDRGKSVEDRRAALRELGPGIRFLRELSADEGLPARLRADATRMLTARRDMISAKRDVKRALAAKRDGVHHHDDALAALLRLAEETPSTAAKPPVEPKAEMPGSPGLRAGRSSGLRGLAALLDEDSRSGVQKAESAVKDPPPPPRAEPMRVPVPLP